MNDFELNILGYQWRVSFVDRSEINGCEGRTIPSQMEIKIANDMPDAATEVVFIHEVIHALMDSQGRCYERKLDVELVCEFIAWNYNIINSIVDSYRQLKKWEEEKNAKAM